MGAARSFAVFVGSVVVLTSCAALSGLDGKEAVDCPGGCTEGGTPVSPPDSSTSADAGADVVIDTGPPACDPTKDVECMQLPIGWTFVARAVPSGGSQPACPSGMTNESTVNESPAAQGDACTCDACAVTAQATCNGQVGHSFGEGAGTTCGQNGSPTTYTNPVAGTCYTDLYTGIWQADRNRFTLPQASGGACSASATKHLDRVTYAATSVLCDDTSRCSGGVCNARIDAPFAICVARAGDEACPSGFDQKHVVGYEGAELDCGACACNVNRAACQGAVHVFNDTVCAELLAIIPANGTCGGPDTEGLRPDSYKVVATSATSCAVASATTPATNARMKNARTICCR